MLIFFLKIITICIVCTYTHWRQSALNSAGALQGGGGEFRGIFTPFFTINFREGRKSGGAHAPTAPASSAPMKMYIPVLCYKHFIKLFLAN